jgi:hypothetical protein
VGAAEFTGVGVWLLREPGMTTSAEPELEEPPSVIASPDRISCN